MNAKKIIFLVIFFSFLSACFHINNKIYKLPFRATKTQIIKQLGEPFKIQRKNGQDHWTYKFVIDGRHYTRTLIIKEGMLYKKENLKPYSLKSF